jgi:hypothetical protein
VPRKKGWLVYAALLTIAVIIGEALNLWRGGPPDLVTYANWILSVALLTALWCYALQRPLGHRSYWRAVFWILVFANLAMLIPVLLDGDWVALLTAGLTLLVVPAYVAAYLYAYRSTALWSTDE